MDVCASQNEHSEEEKGQKYELQAKITIIKHMELHRSQKAVQ